MRIEFSTANRILFGPGVLKEVAPAARALGRRALVVTGRRTQSAQPLLEALAIQKLSARTFAVAGEPSIETVLSGAGQAREDECDFVIGFGGGSALDGAKAIAALATNAGDPLDFLEVVGRGQPLAQRPLPIVAVPTTAGTGAEVTRNAVLGMPEHRVKVSLRSPLMLPELAAVDPELTVSLPPELTATTGLDALTQLIEPFVSCRANPLTDGFCREGLERVARSLRRAYEMPRDLTARADMALASLLSGLALANAGLGAVHGFAGPIGGMFAAPHGAVCAALLPHVMKVNLRALQERQPNAPALARYEEAARRLTGRASACAEDGIAWVRKLTSELKIPPLRAYGTDESVVSELAERAATASSMKGNPIELTMAERMEMVRRAL